MARIRSFRDLIVYARAREEARQVFEVTKGFPKEEQYALTDQVRRSSRAVSALLAEAWGRRRYPGAFVEKLTQASAEALETQAWLDHACDCGYLTRERHAEMDAAWNEVGAMLQGMIRRHKSFCRTASSL